MDKYSFRLLIPAVMMVLIFFFVLSCTRDFSPLSPEQTLRSAADFTLFTPPSPSPYSLKRAGRMSTWEFFGKSEIYYMLSRNYQWENSSGKLYSLQQTVCASHEMAVAFLKMQWETSSIYHGTPRPQDRPIIAGTISYENGRTFIRDNIIIQCHALDDSSLSMADMARTADLFLRKTPTYSSLASVQPEIRKFSITRSRVPLRTTTELVIQVYNPPGGGDLFYDWRFQPAFGGIWQENRKYYFQSYMDNPMTVFLRLIACNSAGFSAWSEIKIETVVTHR